MKRFFEIIDFFPYKVKFNYKGKLHFHTILSQIITVMVYGILLFCLEKFSEDFINKTNPKLILKEKLNPNDRKMNFTEILVSINYTFDITLYTKNLNENFTEVIKNYFKVNFYIDDYENKNNMHFYYNDFHNFQVKNLTNLFLKNDNEDIQSYNLTGTNKDKFKYVYNITFDAFIDKKTLFKYKFFSNDSFNLTVLPNYFIIKDNYKINSHEIKQDVNNLNITLENTIINSNTDYFFYSSYSKIETSEFKIELNDKIGYLCSRDSIIDPEIENFFIPVLEKFAFYKDGYTYSYNLIEMVEDIDWIFTHFITKHIMQIENWSQRIISESENRLDNFQFNISKKMKSQTRIHKKIQNILAEIGGIYSFLIIIGSIALNKFNKTTFAIKIINNLFTNNKNEILANSVNKSIANNTSKLDFNLYFKNNKIINEPEPKILLNPENKIEIINDDNSYLYKNPKDRKLRSQNNTSIRKLLDLISIDKKQNKELTINPNFNNSTSINKNISNIGGLRIIKQENNINFLSKEAINLFFKEKKNKHKKYPLISLSEIEILKFLFCCKSVKHADFIKKEVFYFQAEKKINKYLDAQKLMKLFENFEKLKILLLNRQQINAFDFFKKRDLSEINSNKENNLIDLYKYLKEERLANDQNLIPDNKIILFLDQDIKNLINI